MKFPLIDSEKIYRLVTENIPETAEIVREYGIDYAQGYSMGKPLPVV